MLGMDMLYMCTHNALFCAVGEVSVCLVGQVWAATHRSPR